MTDTTRALREQWLQLQKLHEAGALDTAAYESSKAALERKLLDAVLAAPLAASFTAAPTSAATAATAQPPLPRPQASGRLWAGITVAVVVSAAAGYWWAGMPGPIGQAPPGFSSAADAAPAGPGGAGSAPHQLGPDQMAALVDKLAARMQAQPDDPEGWNMLGRSYMSLGRVDDALAAYTRALKLKPEDATTLTDYADALAVKNGRTLDGEPTQLLERALKLEPDNLKALALAGTAAFNRGDFVTAIKHWDRVAQIGPADGQLVEMARGGAAEARERGKLPPAVTAATGPATGATPAPATAAQAGAAAGPGPGPGISGTVRLAAALKGQAAPEDTVFIFARPAEGSRMPLAIVRKQVKDLPYEFKLDDSQAMAPAARLSGAKRVIVGARISKSGQAMPQPGDLEGLSAAVDVGAKGVTIEISAKLP